MRGAPRRNARSMRAAPHWLMGLLLAAVACASSGPRAIVWGRETCAHCHMALMDPQFAAQFRTGTGKAMVFDDVGCMAAWLAEHGEPAGSAWVQRFAPPHAWLPADSAVYLRSDTLRTPMASGLVALHPGAEADSIRILLGGHLQTWTEVLKAPPRHAAGEVDR